MKTKSKKNIHIRRQTRRKKLQLGGDMNKQFYLQRVIDIYTRIQEEKNQDKLNVIYQELVTFLNDKNITSDLLNSPIPTNFSNLKTKQTMVEPPIFYLILYIIDDAEVVKGLIKLLHKKGANMNIKNYLGQSAIFGELSGDFVGVPNIVYISTLLEVGVDPNTTEEFEVTKKIIHGTPLLFLLSHIISNEEILPPNVRRNEMLMKKIRAQKKFYEACLYILLSRPDIVDINKPTIASQGLPALTPLMVSIQNNDEVRVKQLLDAGADPNLGSTPPLLLSIGYNRTKVLNMLLNHPKIDMNIKDKFGKTALIHVVLYDREDIAYDILSRLTIDQINERDMSGKTALFFSFLKALENPDGQGKNIFAMICSSGGEKLIQELPVTSYKGTDKLSKKRQQLDKNMRDLLSVFDNGENKKSSDAATADLLKMIEEEEDALSKTKQKKTPKAKPSRPVDEEQKRLRLEEEKKQQQQLRAEEEEKKRRLRAEEEEQKRRLRLEKEEEEKNRLKKEKEDAKAKKLADESARKAAEKNAIKNRITEELQGEFWFNYMKPNALMRLKQRIREHILSSEPCVVTQDKMFEFEFNHVSDQNPICVAMLLYGILANILKDECEIYLKGGKAIQANVPGYKSDDIDVFVVSRNSELSAHDIAKELAKMICWLADPQFQYIDKMRDEGSIVKISTKGANPFAVMDIGYSAMSDYVLTQYQLNSVKKTFTIDTDIHGQYIVPTIDVLITEQLYYLILYRTGGKTGKNRYFFEKAHKSINTLLNTKIGTANVKEKEIALRDLLTFIAPSPDQVEQVNELVDYVLRPLSPNELFVAPKPYTPMNLNP